MPSRRPRNCSSYREVLLSFTVHRGLRDGESHLWRYFLKNSSRNVIKQTGPMSRFPVSVTGLSCSGM